jgi:hypothetical protein
MGVNISATGSQSLIRSVWQGGRIPHDVIDLVNIKGYRQIFGGSSIPAHSATDGVGLASHPNHPIIGIALAQGVGSQFFGFVQSFGFGQARVMTGTPAKVFLVPSETPGVLRAVDLSGPEMMAALMGLLDQRFGVELEGDPRPSPIRLIVSLTAESGGLAEVFIF